jgi:hypothetical protein
MFLIGIPLNWQVSEDFHSLPHSCFEMKRKNGACKGKLPPVKALTPDFAA